MRLTKNLYRFCRAQQYVKNFAKLEEQVNIQQKQYMLKKQEIDRINDLSVQTSSDKFNKILCKILNKNYQSAAVNTQIQSLKQLGKKLQTLKEEQQKRCQIAKRLNNEQKQKRQRLFLIDVARFSNQFKKVSESCGYNNMIKEGLTLSQMSLTKVLNKSSVQFFGQENQEYNKSKHQAVEGTGNKVNKVIQRGIKIGQQLLQKSKVTLKKE